MKTVHSSLATAVILLASFAAQSQTLPPDIATKVDKVFDKWNKPDSPGCALGVYEDGHIIYKHG
jgi:CubicO group peptidase (beta-lactamase class C family)